MIFIIPWIFLCFIIGFIGIGRRIGFLGAFFLSLILSPLIGLIITLVSKRKKDIKREKQMLQTQKNQEKALRSMADNAKGTSKVDELTKLRTLRNEGDISDEEFQVLKAKIVNG